MRSITYMLLYECINFLYFINSSKSTFNLLDALQKRAIHLFDKSELTTVFHIHHTGAKQLISVCYFSCDCSQEFAKLVPLLLINYIISYLTLSSAIPQPFTIDIRIRKTNHAPECFFAITSIHWNSLQSYNLNQNSFLNRSNNLLFAQLSVCRIKAEHSSVAKC